MNKNNKITESLYEIITGLSGYRSENHTKWEREAKRHLKRIIKDKNILLEGNTIQIQNSKGTKVIYQITINK